MSDHLIFSDHPDVLIASNTFKNVPVVLQYDTIPLIRVVRDADATYTPEISIYHPDGTYLAKAKGSQLYLTEPGKKVGLTLRHLPGMTVCELDGRTLFELRRQKAAAFKATAELYTSDGAFLQVSDHDIAGYVIDQMSHDHLQIHGLHLSDTIIHDIPIGILVYKDGRFAVGVG